MIRYATAAALIATNLPRRILHPPETEGMEEYREFILERIASCFSEVPLLPVTRCTLVAVSELIRLYHKTPDTVPAFRGRDERRNLTRQWGLPNAYPRDHESLFGDCRVLFVDDDDDGRPVAVWLPD